MLFFHLKKIKWWLEDAIDLHIDLQKIMGKEKQLKSLLSYFYFVS